MARLTLIPLTAILLAACTPASEPVVEGAASRPALVTASPAATDLGSLGGNTSFALDINDRGVVVGQSTNAAGQIRGFRWTASEGMTDLGTLPGGSQSGAVRILNSGLILGWSESAGGQRVPVQWSATGRIVALPIPKLPEVYWMSASDFNQRGEVVGYAVGDYEHGWYWSKASGVVDLRGRIPSCLENGASAINAGGLVAGTFCNPNFGWLHPFTWRNRGDYLDLGVGDDVYNANGAALAINDAGTVAGWLDPHGNVYPNATLWSRAGKYVLLPNLSATYPSGYAQGLSSSGVAVGASYNESLDAYQPVAWPSSTTLVRLNGDGSGFGVAMAINDRGLIVGWGQSTAGGIRALLWRLSDGKAERVLSPGGAVSVSGAAAIGRAARAGAEACLSDPKAMTSKAGMAECVMRRGR